MKRYHKVFALLAVLVVIGIATFALTQYEEEKEKIKNTDAVILQIASDSVTELSWKYEGDSALAFHKGEEGWRYDGDEAFPVSEEKVMDILAHFEDFAATFIIEDVTDYSQYGMDDPECTIYITTAEKTYDIKLGAFSKMDEQRYVDIGDGNVYLVGEDPMDYVDSSLSAMILHDDTPGFETVVDITFSGSENYTITRVDDSTDTYNSGDDIYFVDRDGKTVPMDTANVRKYLNTVTSLDLLDYVTYNATEEELASFGLDNPELSVTVNYTYTETNEAGEETVISDTCVFHLGRNAEEQAAYEEAVAKGDSAPDVTKYVRIGDSQIVYELDPVDYGILAAAAYDDLRHEEVFWADFEIVTGIDITIDETKYTLVSKAEDEERTWYYPEIPEETGDEEEASENEIDLTDIENALEALVADSFTSEEPTGKEEIRLTIHLDHENFPKVEIVLYRYDGNYCLAAVDGESVSLIERSLVVDLIEAVNAIVL